MATFALPFMPPTASEEEAARCGTSRDQRPVLAQHLRRLLHGLEPQVRRAPGPALDEPAGLRRDQRPHGSWKLSRRRQACTALRLCLICRKTASPTGLAEERKKS